MINFNKDYNKNTYQSEAYQDKIYNNLQKDNIRVQFLDRTLEDNKCDRKVVYNFLRLLKIPEQIDKPLIFTPILIEE